jgi:FixJ family two-component response regulator
MAAQPTVVVVVDDNPGFLKSVTRLLTVQTATCLLLDIHLGGISGIELQRRLVAAGSTCPIIFMTAIDDDNTRKEAMDMGCIAYLQKPFSSHLLLNAISKAMT